MLMAPRKTVDILGVVFACNQPDQLCSLAEQSDRYLLRVGSHVRMLLLPPVCGCA